MRRSLSCSATSQRRLRAAHMVPPRYGGRRVLLPRGGGILVRRRVGRAHACEAVLPFVLSPYGGVVAVAVVSARGASAGVSADL